MGRWSFEELVHCFPSFSSRNYGKQFGEAALVLEEISACCVHMSQGYFAQNDRGCRRFLRRSQQGHESCFVSVPLRQVELLYMCKLAYTSFPGELPRGYHAVGLAALSGWGISRERHVPAPGNCLAASVPMAGFQ